MGAAHRACSGRLTARSRRGWYIQHNWLKRFVAVLRLAEGLCFFFWLSGLTRGDLVATRAFRFCRTGPHLPPPFGRHRAVAAPAGALDLGWDPCKRRSYLQQQPLFAVVVLECRRGGFSSAGEQASICVSVDIQQPGANACARPALACVLPPAASPVLLKAFGGAWAAVVHFAVLRVP